MKEDTQKQRVECAHTKLVALEELIPNPRNPNKHPDRQIEMLANNMKRLGIRSPIVVSKRSGFIVKGHGRLMAAQALGVKKYPVDFQAYESEAKEYADMVADNKLAEQAASDENMIIEDARRLKDEIEDFDLLGIDGFMLPEDIDKNNEYSLETKTPIYEIKGDNPKTSELYDATKTKKLTKKIEAAGLPKEVELFLIAAAQRHTVFSYEKIAEFYAHSNKDLQELMEASALVVIDLDKAIEEGFATLTKDMQRALSGVKNG